MIELITSWAGPLLALLSAIGVTGILAYTKGKARAESRADALREADRQQQAQQRVTAAQVAANKQITATQGALDAQKNANQLDDAAVARELRDKWTRPE